MTCGIYLIVNNINQHKYIGQSINIERRWREHCHGKDNIPIDNAINKYGKNNFNLIILFECYNDIDLLNEMEKYYIWKYNTYQDKKHYNLTIGGDFCPSKNSQIAKKISNKLKGRKLSEEHKKKISQNHACLSGKESSMYGKHHSKETCQKISKKLTGRKMSLEERDKMAKKRNTSGYYRVYKRKKKDYKQGFIWAYAYRDETTNKKCEIQSVDIDKLEQKVKNKKLKWLKYK